jgi:hypothetical protein
MFYYYHWVDTSASGLLVSEDIIRPVVNASALAIKHASAEALNPEWMMSSGSNSPLAEVSTQ